MNRLAQFLAGISSFGLFVVSAQAGFSSLYVFGDGVCTTTNNTSGGTNFYGRRFTNGRVWLEALAHWQGVAYDSNKNWSYFGQGSSDLTNNVRRFSASDANTALFVVWACDADFVLDINYLDAPPYTASSLPQWTNAINLSLTNHYKAITNLYYAKGVRTLVMPNAVDISKVPFYAMAPSDASFFRQRVIDFNTRFAALLGQVSASLPGLTIYSPDFFALVDRMLANPGDYGLIKPNTYALADLANKALNGPGTNYFFWDYQDPTAMTHMRLAEFVQQLMSPVSIGKISSLNGSNRLDMLNLPIGRNGFVSGSTNLVNWTLGPAFNSTNATESLFVPVSGPMQFYRLSFPFVWTWP